MERSLSICFMLLFLILASCEDTEKSRKNNTTSSGTTETTQRDTPATDTIEVKDIEVKQQQKNDQGVVDRKLRQEELIPFMTEYGKENPENRVRISTEFGDIEVLLYQDTPLHRANFIYLVKNDYFNGTFFHRVAKDFVIQGGNSDNPRTSQKRNNIGSYLIPAEFEAGHTHTRGAFSAAKYAHQNVSKASSPFEFFIVQSQRGAHHLDNDHTVFGRVTKGMDVVDEIAEQEVSEGEWPQTNIPITVEIIE